MLVTDLKENNIELCDDSIQNIIIDLNNKIKILETENQQLKNKIINIKTNLNTINSIVTKISNW